MELCVSGPWALSRDTGVVRIRLMEGRKSSSTLLCSVWRHNISLTSCLVVPPSPNKSRFWWNLGDFLYVYIIHLYLQVSRGQVILSTCLSQNDKAIVSQYTVYPFVICIIYASSLPYVQEMTFETIPPEVIMDCAQLVKANSIQGMYSTFFHHNSYLV